MAKSSKSVPANRFAAAPEAVVRQGFCDLAPGRYLKGADAYGVHFRRVLPDAQTVDYTITSGGMLIEKINFVPSKQRRDGNAAYGQRWLGILEYRQSDDYASDLEFAVENGMKMVPEPKAGTASKAGSVWKAC
jgi:hypothetical protein